MLGFKANSSILQEFHHTLQGTQFHHTLQGTQSDDYTKSLTSCAWVASGHRRTVLHLVRS